MDARKLPSMYIPLWGVFIFGLLTILYFAKAIFIPIFIIGLTSYFVLLYLLLAFSKSLGRDAGTLLMNKSYYKAMITIARQAQARISYYLLVITLINIVLGCIVTLATWATGLPNPMVWGVSAALLNYIPYVGPAINIGIVSLVSLLTFDTLSQVVLPPLVVLGINLLEGQFVQPMTVGRVFTINPVVVFLSIIIWGWLWGVAGVFMAVPILMVVAITLKQHRKFRRQRQDTPVMEVSPAAAKGI